MLTRPLPYQDPYHADKTPTMPTRPLPYPEDPYHADAPSEGLGHGPEPSVPRATSSDHQTSPVPETLPTPPRSFTAFRADILFLTPL